MARKSLVESKSEKSPKVIRQLDSYSVFMGFNLKFVSPILMHAFDQKAVEEILHRQLGHPVEQLPKVPAQCIERATMRNTKGEVCLMSAQFKAAILAGAAGLESTRGLQLKSKFWVVGNSIPITYSSMTPRMDMVQVGPWNNRTVDVRFRPQFDGAACSLVVEVPEKITPEMVVGLLDRAGKVGVGDWRPQKGGMFGRFVIEGTLTSQKDIRETIDRCEAMVPPLVIPEWAMDAEISPVVLARIMDESRKIDVDAE